MAKTRKKGDRWVSTGRTKDGDTFIRYWQPTKKGSVTEVQLKKKGTNQRTVIRTEIGKGYKVRGQSGRAKYY